MQIMKFESMDNQLFHISSTSRLDSQDKMRDASKKDGSREVFGVDAEHLGLFLRLQQDKLILFCVSILIFAFYSFFKCLLIDGS